MLNNWLHRTTKILHLNVSPGDMAERYGNLTDWIYDPDMSAVDGHPAKHWTINLDDTISLKEQTERDQIDADEAQAATDADRAEQKGRIDKERILKAVVLVMLDEINLLRDEHGLANRTPAQVLNAVTSKVDNV